MTALSHSHSPRRSSPATEIDGEAVRSGSQPPRHRTLIIGCHTCGHPYKSRICRVCGSHSLVLVAHAQSRLLPLSHPSSSEVQRAADAPISIV